MFGLILLKFVIFTTNILIAKMHANDLIQILCLTDGAQLIKMSRIHQLTSGDVTSRV